jgi:hypothetical protein
MYAPTRREVEPITNRTAGMALNPGSLTDRTFDNPTRFDIRAPDAGAMALDWSCVTLAYSDKRDWRAPLCQTASILRRSLQRARESRHASIRSWPFDVIDDVQSRPGGYDHLHH